MNYREQQRERITKKREALFKDPGNGIFFGKKRDFVLSDPLINLWEGVRYDAVDYFRKNNITWWQGDIEEPTGHLLSSQIACLNHLYFTRQREDIASAILKNLDPNVDSAVVVDDGYVEFEFIGSNEYKIPYRLGEKYCTRGANCTSVDAVMIGQLKVGTRQMFLIEWKYTESYSNEDKYIEERASRYDHLITADESPFIQGVDVRAFYFEPFYQLMRQTLFGSQSLAVQDYGISEYKHIHVVPMQNNELRNRITSPYLVGQDIHEAWINVLKDKNRFMGVAPEDMLQPVRGMNDTKSIIHYLEERYWN
jgi:hypothetical protein